MLKPGKTYSVLEMMGVEKDHRIYQEVEIEVREQIAKEIENAVIEVVGNSAATMQQAARIARGQK